MNFKNLGIVIALLSLELKVFSFPIKKHKCKGHIIPLDKKLSVYEIPTYNVSDDSNFEDAKNDSDFEWESLDIPTEPVEGVEEITDIPTEPVEDVEETSDISTVPVEDIEEISDISTVPVEDIEEISDIPTESVKDAEETSYLPCSDFYDCIDWLKENKVLDAISGQEIPDIVYQYATAQYQNGKVEEIQQQFEALDYGMKVDVNGHKMSVDVLGEQHNQTIVLLPGVGIINTIQYYKSLAESLSTDYKVVTIEPFGYGLSDIVTEERTAENIVSEIHTCLQKLGIDKFYFIGHSFGGIYSVVYDNKYPDEVLGFIGLDNTPSNWDKFPGNGLNEIELVITGIFDKYHMWGLFPDEVKKAFMISEEEQSFLNYSEEELRESEIILSNRKYNLNIMEEIILEDANVASTLGMYFHCPLLMFIASENYKKDDLEWQEYHDDMITNSKTSEIVPLEAKHSYIHVQQKEKISEEIKKWIK